ncbi:hypothetical protein [Paraburkholderia sediminicola]|uniref:hypothetical protein n=1 Tax=Paraburkholderia sediminicola TaxID=458836 RepID=UPI0038B6DC1A
MIKELSMTPDAIKKRELRAQAKMAELAKQMELPQQPEFTVLKVGHAFIKGKGNAKPKKDSVWGILLTGDVLVKFYGRRGGAIRFKQEPISALDAALVLYGQKLAGTDVKRLKHDEVAESEQTALLGEGWSEALFARYKQALADNKVDTYVAQSAAKPQPAVDPRQTAWKWPTAAEMTQAASSSTVVL